MAHIHNITKDGYIEWHCIRHDCSHHNCANWHELYQCPHHDEVTEAPVQVNGQWVMQKVSQHGARTEGTPNRIHFTDPRIVWTDEHMVNLPPCEECGGRLGMIVNYSDDQWAHAHHTIVVKDSQGQITRVYPHPGHANNRKLGSMLDSINSKYQPT